MTRPTRLSDLPAMTVLKAERVSGVLSIDGRFDRLDGVRSGGYFRIAQGEYALAELEFVKENPTGYADDFPHFLCAACHAKYGEAHDLSFLL